MFKEYITLSIAFKWTLNSERERFIISITAGFTGIHMYLFESTFNENCFNENSC